MGITGWGGLDRTRMAGPAPWFEREKDRAVLHRLLSSLVLPPLMATSLFGGEVTINKKGDGYRGIWYQNQPLKSEYKFKYSGGLGTYCAKHKPFAVYCPTVHKTFLQSWPAERGEKATLLPNRIPRNRTGGAAFQGPGAVFSGGLALPCCSGVPIMRAAIG